MIDPNLEQRYSSIGRLSPLTFRIIVHEETRHQEYLLTNEQLPTTFQPLPTTPLFLL